MEGGCRKGAAWSNTIWRYTNRGLPPGEALIAHYFKSICRSSQCGGAYYRHILIDPYSAHLLTFCGLDPPKANPLPLNPRPDPTIRTAEAAVKSSTPSKSLLRGVEGGTLFLAHFAAWWGRTVGDAEWPQHGRNMAATQPPSIRRAREWPAIGPQANRFHAGFRGYKHN